MRFRPPIAWTGLLLALALPAWGAAPLPAPDQKAEPWYQVEVIVFTQQSDDDEQPVATDAPPPPASTALPEGALPALPDALELGPVLQRLRHAPGYRVLAYRHWRQPGWAADQARPVPVRFPPPPEDAGAAITAPDPATDATAPSQDTPLLWGTLTLSRARYLHLDLDLWYRPEPPSGDRQAPGVETPAAEPPGGAPADSGEPLAAGEGMEAATEAPPVPLLYHLHQNRRMRSRETHYIDHPRLGVIARAIPVEPPPPPAPPPAPEPVAPGPAPGTNPTPVGPPPAPSPTPVPGADAAAPAVTTPE